MAVALDQKLIETIKDIGKRYALDKIVLFGSRARGDNRPNSDIDLVVYPSAEFNDIGLLTSELEDLDTLLKIDVTFIKDDTEREFLERIKKEGVVLYERLS